MCVCKRSGGEAIGGYTGCVLKWHKNDSSFEELTVNIAMRTEQLLGSNMCLWNYKVVLLQMLESQFVLLVGSIF